MGKKKVVLIISSCVFVLLAGCTVASFWIYDKNLPRVDTFYYRTAVQHDFKTIESYLPEESIALNSRGDTVAYRLQKRMGWFSEEFYVEEIPLDYYYEDGELVYREEDGYLRVVLRSLEEGDQIVKEPVPGLQDGLTVKWESGERGKYDAAVWY